MTVFLDLEDALSQITYLGFNVRDIGLLEGCLARPRTTLFGDEAYPTIEEKAAALMHSVATTHPLIDDNKRTSWALLVTFLAVNDLQVIAKTQQAFDCVVSVATDSLEVTEISAWLREGIRPLTSAM
jgi:death-on-curing protein